MKKQKKIKTQAIDLIQSLPYDCTPEDIQYHLYVREKVEKGIKAIEDGRTMTQEKAEAKVKEWLKSFGQIQR